MACNKNSESNISSTVHDRISRLNRIQLAAKGYLHYRLTPKSLGVSGTAVELVSKRQRSRKLSSALRELANCLCSHIALCTCSGRQRLIEFVRGRKAPVANERSFFFCKVVPYFSRGFFICNVYLDLN